MVKKNDHIFTAEDLAAFERSEQFTTAENITDEDALLALCGHNYFNANLTPSTWIVFYKVLQSISTPTLEESEMIDCLFQAVGWGGDMDKVKRVISRAMKREVGVEDPFQLVCGFRLFWHNLSKDTQHKIAEALEVYYNELHYDSYTLEGIWELEQRFFTHGYLSRGQLEKQLVRVRGRGFNWSGIPPKK